MSHAARELSLWRGDMRRRTQLLSVATMTLLSGFGPLVSSSVPFSAAWGAWFVIYLAMVAGSNLYGFDGASVWHLVMIPEAAAADVRGRQFAWAIVMTPFALVATTAVRVFGDLGTDRLAVPIAICISMMGVGAGLAVAISAKAPYPVREMKKTFSLNTRGSFNGSSFGLIVLGIVIFAATTAPGVPLWALLRLAHLVRGSGAVSRSAVCNASRIGFCSRSPPHDRRLNIAGAVAVPRHVQACTSRPGVALPSLT